ncbi:MAG: EamA family transporter RarD [Calditrichaeota bacterium]|nr:MAG: EamA family transporter RarD [Calditrichota bacterium]
MNRGTLYGIIAYGLWGILPLYWKLLQGVQSLEILAHRIIWSLLFVILLLFLQNNWRWLNRIISRPTILLFFSSSAILLAVNWLTFIWAVNNGFIVEASLGYFINPLLNVLLGVLFLKERLRIGQSVALMTTACGVSWLTIHYGSFPWIALTLAITFGIYGLLRKIAPLDSIEGLALETALLMIPAVYALFYFEQQHTAQFLHNTVATGLLFAAGIITSVPLILFSSAARRISLTALGFIQYIAPTLQFLTGILIYHEPFNSARFVGFSLIWAALALYTLEGLHNARRRQRSS